MSKVEPLPAKPTIADLAAGQNQLHSCFEDFRSIATERFDSLEAAIKTNTGTIDDIRLNQKLIAQSLAVVDKDGNPKKPIDKVIISLPATKTGIIKFIAAIGSSVGGVFLLWKVVWTTWPFIWQALIALNHMVLK